jgi:hypothetical protein
MDTTTETSDLREELESSFDAVVPDSTEIVAEPAVSTEPAAIEEAPPGETAEQKAQREYIRDEQGKFAPKDSQNSAVLEQKTNQNEQKRVQEGVKAAEKMGQPPAQKDPLERAPQAWKPEAREYWKDIPPAARAEIVRHEQQVQAALRETVQQRQFADSVQKVIEPYRGLIESEGSNVISAIGNMLQTAQALRTAPPAHKAALVANMVKEFGIDVNQLDQALVGKIPPAEPPEVVAVKQQLERELAPVRQWQQQQMMQMQMMEQQKVAEAERGLQEFSRNAEFINDVRYLMADIIELRERNHIPYSLEEVYKAACQAHPEVSKVIAQRSQQQQAMAMTSTAQKARQAAVSVGGSPALGGSDEPPTDSIRDSLMFAMNQSMR